jgi:phage replication-related protein YjqB (UPF0714/DUF867 family)
MPTDYAAQIRKLRLPEQDELRNEMERCSGDPVMLEPIGRAIGQQVRIVRKDDPRFFALYTVKLANPDIDQSDPASASVIRTGEAGRERLGTAGEMEAIVQAKVVDAASQPGGVRFFEVADDDGKKVYFAAVAPHGGDIEKSTNEQAADAVRELAAAGFPASLWLCEGYGDQAKGAFDRWHITSTDLQPACFPLLQSLMSRQFCYGVAFHGFQRKNDEADVYIGGAASQPLKAVIERALNDLNLPIKIKISTCQDSPKFQGFSLENLVNRLATAGIHLEQSFEARKFHGKIARAIAEVFASRWRFLLCVFIKDLENQRAGAEAELAHSLSSDLAAAELNVDRAIEKHKAWREKDRGLEAKIKACEELRTFIEVRVEELKTTQPAAGSPAQTSRNRNRKPRPR